ncbi:MAG: DUF6082 family protein [Streptomyces sp.]|nr:DUF6082 family protein [Streptomyces sp.]
MVLGLVLSSFLVVVSPLVLRAVGPGHDGPAADDAGWQRVADIATTYGAASALLTVLTLGAVAYSLRLQAMESRFNREQGTRAHHVELLRMAIDDPDLMACWSNLDPGAPIPARKQHLYVNLLLSHWETLFAQGALSEGQLRLALNGVFSTAPGRVFWTRAREDRARAAASGSSRARAFHAVAEAAFHGTDPRPSDPDRPRA